jgi:hypothetical protein
MVKFTCLVMSVEGYDISVVEGVLDVEESGIDEHA